MIERWITRALIATGPWALALAPAYLVWSGLQAQLWPAWLCWIVAAAVEIFGTSATGVALELRSYNQRRRKTDDAAPERTAWAIAGVYIATISVFCGLHAFPGTEKVSLVLWPVMGASAMIVRALSKDHVQRLETIAAEKVERKAERAQRNAPEVQPVAATLPQVAQRVDTKVAILKVLRNDPHATPTEVARQVGISRQAVAGHLQRLEASGAIHNDNGHGVEVL